MGSSDGHRGIPVACLSAGFVVLIAASVTADDRVTFDEHVAPIFQKHCVSCHNADDVDGGLDLMSHRGALAGGGSGDVIVPGAPHRSRLLGMISGKESPAMPPDSESIPKEEIEIVRRWIADGAPRNASDEVVKTAEADPLSLSDTPAAPVGTAVELGGTLVEEDRKPVPSPVVAMDLSPNQPLLAVANDREIVLYHATKLVPLTRWEFPWGTPHVVRFSRDGRLLVAGGGVGGKSGGAVIWSVESGRKVFECAGELDVVLAADLSPDQTLLAVGGPKRKLRVYSTADGQLVRTIDKHGDWITAVRFSPDGVLLASADRVGKVHLWESLGGHEFAGFTCGESMVTELAWRHDSNVLAGSSEDGMVRVWGLRELEEAAAWEAHPGGTLSLVFARDGRSIASCGRDDRAKLWNPDGSEIRAFEAHLDDVLQIAFNQDGARLAVGDFRGDISVYSTENGERLGSAAAIYPSMSELLAQHEEEPDSAGELPTAEVDELKNAARTEPKSSVDHGIFRYLGLAAMIMGPTLGLIVARRRRQHVRRRSKAAT